MSISAPPQKQNVPITETWDRTSWVNWDTYLPITTGSTLGRTQDPVHFPFSVADQQHVDLRTFLEAGWTGSLATGYQSSLNHWPAAIATLTAGSHSFSQTGAEVDLTIVAGGRLALALPAFPFTDLDLNASTITLGDGTHTASVPLHASIGTLQTGNSKFVVPLTAWTGVDLTDITLVTIQLVAINNCTVRMAALRVIGPRWIRANVDFDNASGQLRQGIPLNGDTSAIVPNNQMMPTLWRSSTIAGVDDPRPINAEVSYVFNTGSLTGSNVISVFMREETHQFVTQLDLEGTLQSVLEGQPQDNFNVPHFLPRTMADMDQLDMSDLASMSMLDLEQTPDPSVSSWVRFSLTWGPVQQLQITNSVQPSGGYVYDSSQLPALAPNASYLVVCNLTEIGARVLIYPFHPTTLTADSPIFDTLVIQDSYTFARRSGRIGFQASFSDGDAFLEDVRPRGLMFAEYRSAAFASITPVKGARLYVQSTPNSELFTGWTALSDATPHTPLLVADASRATTQASTAVTVVTPSSGAPTQGVISNILTPLGDPESGITNFAETVISFDLWVPSAAMHSTTVGSQPVITARLRNSAATFTEFALTLPQITPDHWQHFKILPPTDLLPGPYQLVLYYNGGVATTWWVDNVHVGERAIKWSGRSVVDDPWHSNDAPWTDFRELLNSDTDGVRFTVIGKQLQVRAQALRQDAAIFNPLHVVPIYAELGNLVWPIPPQQGSGGPVPPPSGDTFGGDGTFGGAGTYGS